MNEKIIRNLVISRLENVTDYSEIKDNFAWLGIKEIADNCDDCVDNEEIEKQINLFLSNNGYYYDSKKYKWHKGNKDFLVVINGYSFDKVHVATFKGYVMTECEILFNGEKIGTLEDDGRSYLNVFIFREHRNSNHEEEVRKLWLDILELEDIKDTFQKSIANGNIGIGVMNYGTLEDRKIYEYKTKAVKKVLEYEQKFNKLNVKFFESENDFIINDPNFITIAEKWGM